MNYFFEDKEYTVMTQLAFAIFEYYLKENQDKSIDELKKIFNRKEIHKQTHRSILLDEDEYNKKRDPSKKKYRQSIKYKNIKLYFFRDFAKQNFPKIVKFAESQNYEIFNLDDDLLNDIEEIIGEKISINTEKENLIKCRIGQGEFRDKLIKHWQGCSVTGLEQNDILIASHIKPWSQSDNEERLDPFNGLLLLPTLDKLFDKGYISFDDNGSILISKLLTNYDILGINEDMKIKIEEEHKKYLNYHRNEIFE